MFDLPEGPLLRVVEHIAQQRRCGCGCVTAGFPDGVGAPTQFGLGIRALGAYLVVFQHLPYDRAAQALRDLAGAAVSTGTLIDDAGVLPSFGGVAVHDGWAPYRNYEGCEHGLCNVHHLRELQAACEAGHTWPLAMSWLPCAASKAS